MEEKRKKQQQEKKKIQQAQELQKIIKAGQEELKRHPNTFYVFSDLDIDPTEEEKKKASQLMEKYLKQKPKDLQTLLKSKEEKRK